MHSHDSLTVLKSIGSSLRKDKSLYLHQRRFDSIHFRISKIITPSIDTLPVAYKNVNEIPQIISTKQKVVSSSIDTSGFTIINKEVSTQINSSGIKDRKEFQVISNLMPEEKRWHKIRFRKKNGNEIEPIDKINVVRPELKSSSIKLLEWKKNVDQAGRYAVPENFDTTAHIPTKNEKLNADEWIAQNVNYEANEKLERIARAEQIPSLDVLDTKIEAVADDYVTIDDYSVSDLESQAMKLEGMSDLKNNIDQAERFKDSEVMKEEMMNKAKESTINHFAGRQEELKGVMMQLAKVKSKIPDLAGDVDLFKKKYANSIKGEHFKKRIVPGVTLQIRTPDFLWVDLNPHIGYMLSGRFTGGLGWNERLVFDYKEYIISEQERIYGFRSFLHFKLKENTWIKIEAERVNTFVPYAKSILTSDPGQRYWVWNYYAGLKKDFQLSKKLKGNVQIIYTLFNPLKRSPDASKLTVRMGVELVRKKKLWR
jgi:hypothetical protein